MSQDVTLTKPIGDGAAGGPTADLGTGEAPRRRLGSWQVPPGATDALAAPLTPARASATVQLPAQAPKPYVMSASDATLPFAERELKRAEWEAQQALASTVPMESGFAGASDRPRTPVSPTSLVGSQAASEETLPSNPDATAPIALNRITRPRVSSPTSTDDTVPFVGAVTGPMPAGETVELSHLRRRITEDPSDLDATLELALALHEADRLDEATTLLTNLLALHESVGATDEASQVRRLLNTMATREFDSATTEIGTRTTGLEGATAPMGTPTATAPVAGNVGRTTLQLATRTAPLDDRFSRGKDGRRRAAAVEGIGAELVPREQLVYTEPLPGIDRLAADGRDLFANAEQERVDGHFRTALDSLNHAITMSPSALGLWLRLAELRLRLGHRRKAREILVQLRSLTGDADDAIPSWMVERLLLHTSRPTIDSLQGAVRLLTAAQQFDYASTYAAALIQRLDAAGKSDEAVECAARMAATLPGDTRIALEGAILAVRLASHGEVIDLWEAAVAAGADADVARASMAASVASMSEDDHWRLLADTLALIRADARSLCADAYLRTAEAAGASPILQSGRALVLHAMGDIAAKDALAGAAGDRHGSPVGRAAAAIALAYRLSAIDKNDEYIAAVRTSLTLMASDAMPSEPNWLGMVGFEPDLAELSTELGEALLEAGDAAGAVEILRSWHQRSKGHGPLVRLLADAYGRTGQVGSALTILDDLAMHHRKAGRLDDMAAVLRQMSRLAPTNIKVKSRLIDAYLQRGFVSEARAELIQRVDLETQAGMVKEACKSLQRAADLSWNLGLMNESFALYDRLLALDPEDVGNRSALVNLYLQVGRLTEAAEHQRAVVDLALKNGRRHEAIAALHQVIGLTPDDMSAYYQLGELLSSMGEYQQAEKVYRRIVLMSPDDAVAQAKATSMAALKEQMTAV